MRQDLPTGTVTFLFTDVEGSTRLLHELGADAYAEALAEHRRVIREACAPHDGVEVDTQGDAFFLAFPTASGALAAAREMTQALASGRIRVRVGLHTGTPLLTDEGYIGGDVHRAARIAAAGHGGQVLVSASTAQLVELALTDLGEHRLKDLSAPERVFQLGDGTFPALKSLYRTNLPIPSTPFLGRERELKEVVALLSPRRQAPAHAHGARRHRQDPARRSCGRTRGGRLSGRRLVGTACTPPRPRLVLETAAQAVGSKNGLAEHIADKSMLLLFDNFEQVVEAAHDVASLLAACPQLDLLVTSREPLHVSGEQEYPVPPLVHEEGVGFFLARASAVGPTSSETRPSPRSAGAWTTSRLRSSSQPHGSRRSRPDSDSRPSRASAYRFSPAVPATCPSASALCARRSSGSYDLLTADEQRLFARLAVFRGGCTLEAAEKVAGADLDTLQSLVEKSLLRFSNERYWMLETIREYAHEQFMELRERDRTREAHLEYFVAVVMDAESRLTGKDQESLLEALQADYGNIRASLDYLQHHDSSRLLECAAALWWFWRVRGYFAEGSAWLERGLESVGSPPALRAQALNGASNLARLHGDLDAAALYAEDELQLARGMGEPLTVAKALTNLGTVASERLEFERALELQREAVHLVRALDDARPLAVTLGNVGYVMTLQGDAHAAIPLFEESLELHRRVESLFGECSQLLNLGAAHQITGDVDTANDLFVEALRAAKRLGSAEFVGYALQGVAATIAVTYPHQAAVLLGASGRLLDEARANLEPVERQLRDTALQEIVAALDDAASEALATGALLDAEDAVERAFSIDPT